ncbi:nicotinate-nucleotide adenylyltransferase [Salisaeta longa]|uniref:nicotinate-nucleotide adenylyltransferase n=1 Tax=Salisaeta longa TaxID=503170 RepID=UPI0003B54EA3|nr:nicotinate-nucleotide adenylyltransferase [Salisaeta longa]
MTIGLFGGSFNPPHVAHCIIAEVVRDQFELDEIWWIPNGTPPHKTDRTLASAAHRKAMVQRVTDAHAPFRLCTVEMERDGPSYTVDTLRRLQARHPQHDFHLIIGSDSLDTFASWRAPDEIVERVPLIVYKRPGGLNAVAERRFANRVRYAAAPVLELSSTEVRARRRAGRSIRFLVPDAVQQYITSHDLYAGD